MPPPPIEPKPRTREGSAGEKSAKGNQDFIDAFIFFLIRPTIGRGRLDIAKGHGRSHGKSAAQASPVVFPVRGQDQMTRRANRACRTGSRLGPAAMN